MIEGEKLKYLPYEILFDLQFRRNKKKYLNQLLKVKEEKIEELKRKYKIKPEKA